MTGKKVGESLATTQRQQQEAAAHQASIEAWRIAYASVLSILMDPAAGRSLSFRRREDGGILGVLTRWGDDGAPQVLFAHAESPWSVLVQLEHRVDQGQWKPDKWELERQAGKRRAS